MAKGTRILASDLALMTDGYEIKPLEQILDVTKLNQFPELINIFSGQQLHMLSHLLTIAIREGRLISSFTENTIASYFPTLAEPEVKQLAGILHEASWLAYPIGSDFDPILFTQAAFNIWLHSHVYYEPENQRRKSSRLVEGDIYSAAKVEAIWTKNPIIKSRIQQFLEVYSRYAYDKSHILLNANKANYLWDASRNTCIIEPSIILNIGINGINHQLLLRPDEVFIDRSGQITIIDYKFGGMDFGTVDHIKAMLYLLAIHSLNNKYYNPTTMDWSLPKSKPALLNLSADYIFELWKNVDSNNTVLYYCTPNPLNDSLEFFNESINFNIM